MDIKNFDFYPHEGIIPYTVPETGCTGFILRPETLGELAYRAFGTLSFTFTRSHIEHLIQTARDPSCSGNDRYTASFLLKNAAVAARGDLPLCQDTGVATVFGWKGNGIITADNTSDESALTEGIHRVYRDKNLRFSTVVPDGTSFFDEHDPGTNLPGQILLFRGAEEKKYRFLFCAKGGGSSNKTAFIQATKADLNPPAFDELLKKHIRALGTAACPPYTIAVVAGGLSPEQNLLVLKLATAGFYDDLAPDTLRKDGEEPAACTSLFRDGKWESRVMDLAAETGFGAQFGGKAFAVGARVIRLPRHGASCPVSVGVSCSAHRNIQAYIDETGIYIEKTAAEPEKIPGFTDAVRDGEAAGLSRTPVRTAPVSVDLNEGIRPSLNRLKGLAPGTMVLLSGKILTARDAAHGRWKKLLDSGGELPDYCTMYPICYAGPSGTPPGRVSGSFGPTTAGRMDGYADMLMERGAALVTIAKGNRSEQWRRACRMYGAFYLGTIGGAAAVIADEHILSSRIIDYPELGMEAVRLVEIKDLPAFVLIDNTGADFYCDMTKSTGGHDQ